MLKICFVLILLLGFSALGQVAESEQAFLKTIEQEGIEKGRKIFEDTKQRDPNAVLFREAAMNSLGYKFIREKRTQEAIEIFRLNVEAYPASGNAYDSLAEAYMTDGQNNLAVEFYRKALALIPNNEYVINQLDRLGSPVSGEEWAKLLAAKLPPDVEFLPNIGFGNGGGRPLRLDMLCPEKKSSKPLPVIVFIHGGGWSEGRKERGIFPLVHFTRRGYIGVSVEYRLSSEALFPAQIEDVKCAIRFLRANAKKYNLDPKRIGVWGQSAGGQLAALLGTSGDTKGLEGTGGWQKFSARVNAVADWNGPVDFLKIESALRAARPEDDAIFRLFGGPLLSNKEKAAAANPITYISKDDPPFLILHGDRDRTVAIEQSRLLYEALQKGGIAVEFETIGGDGHFGVSLTPPGVLSDGIEDNRAKIINLMDTFFDKYLRYSK